MSQMRLRSFLLPLAVCAFALLASCGGEEKPFPVRTYSLGERVTLGHIVYVVYETKWLTHLGEGPAARVPQNRYFLVRMSAVNGGAGDVTVPNLTIEDDQGNSFAELSDGTNVPNYIGYLRNVRPADSVQGHALFDAPPRHYKLRLHDEDGERTALIDLPLTFTSETSDVPEAAKGPVFTPKK